MSCGESHARLARNTTAKAKTLATHLDTRRESMRAQITGALALFAASLLILPQGCNSQTNPAPLTVIAPPKIAPTFVAPTGPFPRGTVDPAFQLDPATQGPEIKVLSPARGAQLTERTLDVRLQVQDVNGVSAVTINSIPAWNEKGDEWVAQMTLEPNQVNFLKLSATDGLGNVSHGNFSLTHGLFRSIEEFTDNILKASLNNAGLTRVKEIAESLVGNTDIAALTTAFNPILDNFLAKINIAAVRNDPIQVDINGLSGGAEIKVSLGNAAVDLDINGGVGRFLAQRATITSSRAVATIRARVQRDPNNPPSGLKTALGLEIESVNVQLENFDVVFPSGLLTRIVRLLRNTVRQRIERMLSQILADLVNKNLGDRVIPGLGAPLSVDLPVPFLGTASLDTSFRVSGADGSATTGLGLALGVKVLPKTQVLAGATRHYFVTGTQAIPNVDEADNFAVGLSSDSANALAHAMWLSSVFRYRLDGTNPQPGQTFVLTAKLLLPFFPQLTGLAPDPDTPVSFEITTEAAPTVRLGQNNQSLELTVNELQVRAFIDYMDGQSAREIFTLRTNLQARADVAIVNKKIVVSNVTAPVTTADLVSEPVTDLADAELLNFLNAIMPYALKRFTLNIPAIPIPALPRGLDLQNPRVEISQDFLVVRGKF